MRIRYLLGVGKVGGIFMAALGLGVVWAGAASAAGEIRFPCVGEINTDRTNLRAGRSLNYEIMAKLNKGDRLTVCGYVKGWFRVMPPKGVPFWVSAHYISNGRVAIGRLNVRTRPATSSTVVCQLSRGDQIEEVERRDEWVAIKAPQGADLWVSSELVDLLPEEKGKEKPAVQGEEEMPPPARGEQPVSTAETTVRGEESEEQPAATAAAAAPISGVALPPRAGRAGAAGQAEGPGATTGRPCVYEGKISRSDQITIAGTPFSLVQGFFRSRVVCLLKSQTINLSYYEGDKVKVWGYEISRAATGIPIVDVRKLEIQ